MADEIINEPTSQTPIEPQPAPQSETIPIPPENLIPDPNPAPVPPEPLETSPNPESAAPVKDSISANEPLNQPPETAQNSTESQQTELNPEQNPIPEIPQNSPETVKEQSTAQMAGNESFDKTQDKPIDLEEEIKTKQRQENLKLANETRQEKKREKVDKILEMFSGLKEITNDEVEKLLHVSDATATRYLEQLEKEGKVKQVGKTGKGVKYQRI